jgi:hypothetical protein
LIPILIAGERSCQWLEVSSQFSVLSSQQEPPVPVSGGFSCREDEDHRKADDRALRSEALTENWELPSKRKGRPATWAAFSFKGE